MSRNKLLEFFYKKGKKERPLSKEVTSEYVSAAFSATTLTYEQGKRQNLKINSNNTNMRTETHTPQNYTHNYTYTYIQQNAEASSSESNNKEQAIQENQMGSH